MRKSLLLTVSLLAVLVLVTGCRNKAPKTPAKPSGPAFVKINDTAAYTSMTTDPNKDKVLYAFDWGDGTADTTALFKSGDTVTASHAWDSVGVYPVKVKAKDEKDKWSTDWSDTLMVTVDSFGAVNHPPDAPLKPTHAGIDSTGQPIAFTTSATDPDGDSVQIKFYFADGGTPIYGPKVASGASFTDTVVYQTNGWKVVYAQAMDAFGDTSAQSAPDSVQIHSPNVAPYKPTIITRYTPLRGIAGDIARGPYYRFYASARDEYGDSLYYRWYFDSDSVDSPLFPSLGDGYVTWTPTGDTHTYTVQVRVFDQTGLTNDTLAEMTFKTVGEGEIIWSHPGEFVASPAIGTTLWKGSSWPAIICGSTDEEIGLCVVDAYQSFIVNQFIVPDPWDYNSSAAIGDDGTRYVGNENGWFYAIGTDDSQSDSVKWQFGTGDDGMSATAALGNGGIYCGGDDKKLHKLIDNGASATEAWSYSLRHNLASSPAIGPDGKVVCCDDAGYVYWFDDATGLPLWQVPTGDTAGISSSPAIAADGTIYVGTEAGHLFALKDGNILWSYETNPRFAVSSSPIIGPDGNVYFGCDNGNLYRIDQNSHLPVTDWPVTVSTGAISSTPLLCTDNIIYIAGDDSLFAYDVTNPTAGPRWAMEMRVPGLKGASPRPRRLSLDNQPSAVVDQYGIIYIATETGDGGMFAIAGRSGGTLAATDWPMFHHDAKHTGRSGAR